MTIAFIPVRGGSKSIPLKNINHFCGKPLVYWTVKALENCYNVDKVVVATDSLEIKNTVKQFGFQKVEIYDRDQQNAQDSSSTESVMLEYISKVNLQEDDVFMLVQATSPLTESKHFIEALDLYSKNEYDSLLTCVRNYRFFWNQDGTSLNYDYKNRPRRQDFDGMLMENGAFYINSVKNIVKTKNRLSGKIGIYEMPEYTATEIDEPDDWLILENLMKKYVLKSNCEYNKIKLVLTDVDGVLTDSGMYYSESGDELKKFNTHDGMGFQLLKENNIKTGIITSEQTKIVEKRAKKLKLDYLYQGAFGKNKLKSAIDACEKEGISLSQVAYIGDDLNCKELLSSVGFAFCPFDAVDQIKNITGIKILSQKGGQGAFREMVDIILRGEKVEF